MVALRNAAVVFASVVFAACGGSSLDVSEPDQVQATMSWDEFVSSVYQEPDTGIFIVDGDTPVANFKQLREFYDNNIAAQPSDELRAGKSALILHQNGGVDAKWSDTQKLNLTYCVSDKFGTRKATAVQAMADAGAAWAAAANVKFVYVSSQDSTCTNTNNNVLFDVNPVSNGGQYLARAFFPGTSRSGRNVLIEDSAFSVDAPLTLVGIIRHELGHVLGFRHEHTRPESGTCFEDKNWRALTSYDAYSVMHYPQCNGKGDWSLTLTSMDKSGAVSVYGTPGSGGGTTPPPSGTVVTETKSGSVAKGVMAQVGSFSVVAGTKFKVVMSGSGDPDLYVRWGAAPTTSSYNCRPYLDGASETCDISVPSGVTTAYVGVYGYTAASYSLSITYTKPSSTTTPGGTATSATYTGSVSSGQFKQISSHSVVAGTTFSVSMTGSGDPDLYVRFGSAPTLSAYNCRPYKSGATESCSLTVPSGTTTAYVAVNGYTSGSYSITVKWTKP